MGLGQCLDAGCHPKGVRVCGKQLSSATTRPSDETKRIFPSCHMTECPCERVRGNVPQGAARSCTPRSPRPGRSLLRSPPHPPLAGPACHHAAQAPSAMEYSMESYEPTTPSTVTIVAAFSGGGDEQTVHVIGAPAGQRCSLFLFQNRRGTATRDRKRQTPKGGRWLAPHRPLLKIPVWWRRAVLPPLPWVVCFLSFLGIGDHLRL